MHGVEPPQPRPNGIDHPTMGGPNRTFVRSAARWGAGRERMEDRIMRAPIPWMILALCVAWPGSTRAAEPIDEALATPRVGESVEALEASGPPVAAAAADAGVEALIEEALARNPEIEAMQARTRELSELAGVSGSWSDPRFSVAYMNAPVDSFRIDETPMAGVEFRLSQRLPEWGWTGASKHVAQSRAERSRHARAEAETRLRLSIEQLYWNLALSRQLEGLTHQHLARTEELLRAVRARYEVGRAGQNALLRLDVLARRLADDLGDFTRAQRAFSAALARAVAREPGAQFETPESVAAIPVEGHLEGWLALARASRPELAAMREEVNEQTDAAALSRLERLPDLDVFVAYRLRTIDSPMDDGTDFFSAGVTVPIPVASAPKALAGERAGHAARDGARARLAAALDRVEADLIAADASWRRAWEKTSTYESSLIPAAGAALETTLNDFAVDRAEFSTLYEAEIDLLTLERAHLQANIETLIQRAQVRATTGRVDLGGAP